MKQTGEKVGVSKEEKELSYYRFFEQKMADIPAEKKGDPEKWRIRDKRSQV